MIAEQFVRDGTDEIQHMNFVFLNFMPDVTETRTPARFTEPGKRAAGIDLNSPQVNQFIALLKEHHTVIDPNIAIWENTYTDRPGAARKIERLHVRPASAADSTQLENSGRGATHSRRGHRSALSRFLR